MPIVRNTSYSCLPDVSYSETPILIFIQFLLVSCRSSPCFWCDINVYFPLPMGNLCLMRNLQQKKRVEAKRHRELARKIVERMEEKENIENVHMHINYRSFAHSLSFDWIKIHELFCFIFYAHRRLHHRMLNFLRKTFWWQKSWLGVFPLICC